MLQFILLLIALLNNVSCQGSLTELPSGIQFGAIGVRSVSQSSSSATETTSTESSTSSTTTTETPSATTTTTETTTSTPVSESSSSATVTSTESTTSTATTTETPPEAVITTENTSSTPAPTSVPTPTPTLAATPSPSELVAVDTMMSTDSTENQFVWQGATRVMVGGCFDIQPPSGDICSEQQKLGKCSRNWMFQGGLCAKTCGFCDNECFDIQPTLDYTCAQEKSRNQCSRIGDNFCRATCGRCVPSDTSIEELGKTPMSPKAEKEPTPTPATIPTPTPSAECSCEQCDSIQMQEVLDAVELAVAKVVKEFLQ